jgi:type IV pilus assembly protein PilY1
MMTGRVRISGNEKWVGFVGGGYNGGDCSGGGACDTRGKGFFVIDLANGSVLWSYTMADYADMAYSMPAQPAIVDTDNDGFIDIAYLGDLGGNMWRFKFCRASDGASCGTSNWSGGFLLDSPSGSIRPIYTSAAVAKDTSGRLWVYWGTGDKTDPTAASAQEHFYSVIDSDLTTPIDFNDTDTLASADAVWDSANKPAGYRIQLNGQGEKILADPTVFGGVVYFTTFKPSNSSDPCEQGGEAYLYAVKYTTGSGVLSDGTATGTTKNISIGSGIPSSPVISLKPGSGGSPDLYVTVSGGGGVGANTFRVDMNPPGVSNRSNMLYWLDRRLQ